MDFSIATKGYFREIHRDSDNRIYVFLLFLNKIKNDKGGKFKFHKLKNMPKNLLLDQMNKIAKKLTQSNQIRESL